jgi:glutamate N-acetyltransferase / amino-acid N-acetyltransferase
MSMRETPLARGYRFAGVACGIRPQEPDRLDLALVVSDRAATAAGVFTQNRVVAAPVRVCRERLPQAHARGIVICSGNANACTGQRGLEDALRMAEVTAAEIGCRPEQVLVASTGVIGRHLPMPQVESGIRTAAAELSDEPAVFHDLAARAILTTDTKTKTSTSVLPLSSGEVRITGFAKGAAMIGPDMATLLAFVLTDAPIAMADLATLAPRAAERTFNCISVEGHTSTNDTLLFLANGQGAKLTGHDLNLFNEEATRVCGELARAIAADAEGATHLVTIRVEGLRTEAEARRVAKAVADSALVKTALFGADPNWGRIVSAAGYAGVAFEESQLSLRLGDYLLYDKGTPQPFDAAEVSAYLKQTRELPVRLTFTLGTAACTFYTCDLTYDYVRLNAEYTT